MGERIHALAQLLLGKPSVEDCTLEELQYLTKHYPYFAPAQFLLLQKLKSTGSPDYEKQQQKAVLYYHDPLQFDYFISSDKFFVDETALQQSTQETALHPVTDDGIFTSSDSFNSEEQSLLQQEAVTTIPDDYDAGIAHNETQAENETAPADVFEETAETVDFVSDEQKETAGDTPTQQPESLPIEAAIAYASPEAETVLQKEEPRTNETEISSTESFIEGTAPDEDKQSNEEKRQFTIAQPKATSQTDTLFEPFHTVDYFASQGIKITADELPKDKLSKQLRSFTEWLKVMKRLPAAEVAQTPHSTAEISVENMASHSVEGGEVVTEAMAEVWAKQGAQGKAIETYNKLSLLNPSKKAYFATKIENLKGS